MADERGDEWYTPKWLVEALGEFDLDPAAPKRKHWTAQKCFTKEDNGLEKPWAGRVFMNPPYSDIDPWIYRLTEHGNGIALVFTRMGTRWMDQALCFSSGIFFLDGRVSFVDIKGEASKPADTPSMLIAFGESNFDAIASAAVEGKISGRLYHEVIPHDYLATDADIKQSLRVPSKKEIQRIAQVAADEDGRSTFVDWRVKQAARR